jgi:hypothetical protein
MKRIVRLTESDLNRIVSKVINETKKEASPKKKKINESILLTLGGVALGAGIIKKAYDYISNRMLDSRMEETGETKKGSNGVVMKKYEDNETGELFWGIDVTDKTRDEGFRKRNVLLFKNDPERIERILNSEIIFDDSDEARMSDNFDSKFGQFVADKKIYKGME